MASIDDLHHYATRFGLEVLLEHPGLRWRLAVQTTRANIRAGAAFVRRYSAMTEPSSAQLDEAATALLADLEHTPPTTGESRA